MPRTRNRFSIAGIILGVAGILCGLAPLAMEEPVREERSKFRWLMKSREPERGNGVVMLITAAGILGLASSVLGARASARRENRWLVLGASFSGGIALILVILYFALAWYVLIGVIAVLLVLMMILRYLDNFIF